MGLKTYLKPCEFGLVSKLVVRFVTDIFNTSLLKFTNEKLLLDKLIFTFWATYYKRMNIKPYVPTSEKQIQTSVTFCLTLVLKLILHESLLNLGQFLNIFSQYKPLLSIITTSSKKTRCSDNRHFLPMEHVQHFYWHHIQLHCTVALFLQWIICQAMTVC